jgi:hypothetical protein
MKREYAGSIGYFLMTVPYLKPISDATIEKIAKRLSVSATVLKLMIELNHSDLPEVRNN